MEYFQYKNLTNSMGIGQDTHVRNFNTNSFRQQNSQTYQTVAGSILLTEPEPLFKQNMVTVELARGGEITSVAYPGAFIDPITKNLHGTYEGPIPGQMVMVGFENGNMNSPFVVNRYPYQGSGDTIAEPSYINPLTTAMYDSTDVIIGHFSGSVLSFNTGILSGNLPGSVTLKSATDFDVIVGTSTLIEAQVSAEISSPLITLSASTAIELNGNTNFAVKYTELKTVVEELQSDITSLKSAFSSWITVPNDGGAALKAITGTWFATPLTGNMATTKNDKVLM